MWFEAFAKVRAWLVVMCLKNSDPVFRVWF